MRGASSGSRERERDIIGARTFSGNPRPQSLSMHESMLADPPCVGPSGHVVLTVATSLGYLDAATELAASVRVHGVADCVRLAASSRVVVQLGATTRTLLLPVQLPAWVNSWVPEREFCPRMVGWRLTHVLKTQALVSLLFTPVRGVLCLDADRRLIGNPIPALSLSGADVAGMRDTSLLNFGLILIRATPANRQLIMRVANRSFAAWDRACASLPMRLPVCALVCAGGARVLKGPLWLLPLTPRSM